MDYEGNEKGQNANGIFLQIQPNFGPTFFGSTWTPNAKPSRMEWKEMANANVNDLSISTRFDSSFKYFEMIAL